MAKSSPAVKQIKGGILAASGFRGAGLACGIKSEKGRKDLALLVPDAPAVAAATFTQNKVRAASVLWDAAVLKKRSHVRAVVVNSGNANACTGERGERDTRTMACTVADAIGCETDEVLVSSTGIIGEFLPIEKITKGIGKAHKALSDKTPADGRFADAIQTTDTMRKDFAVRVEQDGGSFVIGGCAKGAGMIGPNMATMLCYITTDAGVEVKALRRMLKQSVNVSFNCISVDGHNSTNDTVLLLSSGASGYQVNTPERVKVFRDALDRVAIGLAKSIVRDGEGATKLVQIDVTGAKTKTDAKLVAHAISRSPLNLTAVHGGDPNWGRFVSSAGYSGAAMKAERTTLFINGKLTFDHGMPAGTPAEELAAEMQKDEIILHIDMGLGSGKVTYWCCDLTRGYITINADYHT
ncbi:MAG: bifunctional glutamate N-acetyltransferase/amino-acid acetyltransferase ArgJ [Planctomycetota bacterium]|jgi:glutamate N-acetyltransferase/amino-acid N-acetyltransferase|nr:bifunctional glutamate N-acetyltransferase/amino-acid acetyltransferase ArgJ [Planctomycetota bacterium]MDP7250238.1 bifunctional glutamate N-acetyltransferase/amino-acid acetyltransferase ArgJ [Planctomycetota bacterium]